MKLGQKGILCSLSVSTWLVTSVCFARIFLFGLILTSCGQPGGEINSETSLADAEAIEGSQATVDWPSDAGFGDGFKLGGSGNCANCGVPFIISQPGTYRGVWSNSTGDCVTITATSGPVIIEGSAIGPCRGVGIVQANHGSPIEVKIRRNVFHDIPSFPAIHLKKAVDSSVSENTFVRTNISLYAQATASMQFKSNLAIDVHDRTVSGKYTGGSLVCYNSVRDQNAQNLISCNRVDNRPGSTPGDIINIYNSNGSSSKPILVQYNKLRGVGTTTRSTTGILLGDGGGSYQSAKNNIVVKAAATGLGIAGGGQSRMELTGNKVYSDGHPLIYFGIGLGKYTTQACSNVSVTNNQINWCGSECSQDRSGRNGGPYGSCSGNIQPFRPSPLLSGKIWEDPLPSCPGGDAGNRGVIGPINVGRVSTTYGPIYHAYLGETFTFSVKANKQSAYIVLTDADTGAVLCNGQKTCSKTFRKEDVNTYQVRKVRASVRVNAADSIVMTLVRSY